MASALLQTLRGLCSGTEWIYAVFWKLIKHRSHMFLTLDDAYYGADEQSEFSEVLCSTELVHDSGSLSYSHDPLGLALVKMSYYGYSLGEGIIGEVAVTGKHRWILSDDCDFSSCPSEKDCDLWQMQFLAGIKTLVFVAIVPFGVLQVGSLQKVNVDLKLVNHIRDAFLSIQESSMLHQLTVVPYRADNLLHLSDQCIQDLDSEVVLDSRNHPEKSMNTEHSNVGSLRSFSPKHVNRSYVLPCQYQPEDAAKVFNQNWELKNSNSGQISKLHEAKLDCFDLEYQNQVNKRLCNETTLSGETSCLGHVSSVSKNVGFCNDILPVEALNFDPTYASPTHIKSSASEKFQSNDLDAKQGDSLMISGSSDMLQKYLMKKTLDIGNNYLSELHEALGPTFLGSSHSKLEEEKSEARPGKMLEEITDSQLTNESGGQHLLEAVIAKVCHSGHDDTSQSLSNRTMSKSSCLPQFSVKSVVHSVDQHSNMEESGFRSSENSFLISASAISSGCPSSGFNLPGSSSDPVKGSRKRARPGENRRPRPRDRQLIQDRLKELRELVPNASKCSIDSLLERTIKHMFFLQSINKHAEKLNTCADLKIHRHETGIMGSADYDQGSSWAIEVSSQLRVHSIVVENLSKNGQLLVEMLCGDCGHFLEIAEAMRSLGLTILKGASEAQGDKTWICFVVEGENSSSIRRMDILWSIVQMLQLKTSSEA